MADFIGSDGDYYIKGDDLEHVWTVIRHTDADGTEHITEYVAPFSTFMLWHTRAVKVIEEVQRRRAEGVIAMLPKGRVRKRG